VKKMGEIVEYYKKKNEDNQWKEWMKSSGRKNSIFPFHTTNTRELKTLSTYMKNIKDVIGLPRDKWKSSDGKDKYKQKNIYLKDFRLIEGVKDFYFYTKKGELFNKLITENDNDNILLYFISLYSYENIFQKYEDFFNCIKEVYSKEEIIKLIEEYLYTSETIETKEIFYILHFYKDIELLSKFKENKNEFLKWKKEEAYKDFIEERSIGRNANYTINTTIEDIKILYYLYKLQENKEKTILEFTIDFFKKLRIYISEEYIKTIKEYDKTIEVIFKERIKNDSFTIDEFNFIDKSHQRIFFGAPGTGKSYLLNEDAKKYFGNDYERVTFHPNYMYGNFIGTFKPFPVRLEDEKETIMYKYIPGILLRLLIKAIKDPNTNYLLVIEEINRANTAAVFGDFFQLLDRNSNGESEYGIAVSEDLKLYLEEQFDKNNLTENEKRYLGENLDKITLPPNFYIWATMNSADQGVMPLDTAFKRRWEFEYIGINDAYDKRKDENGKSEFDTYNFKANENELANWNDFRIKINEILSKCHVPEDKLLGPYFISKSILESGDPDKIKNAIKNKVLMYLYEDAGKQHRRKIFKEGKWETYSKLCEAFDKNCEKIFNDEIELLKSSPKEKAEKIIEQANENKDQNQENEKVTTENNDFNDE
jgi:type II restriction-modification system restriction subunit